MFAGFSIVKLLTGFNVFNGEKLGKLIFNVVIVSCCIAVFYRAFLMKTIKNTQTANTINNTYVTQAQEDKSFVGIGFHLWKLKAKVEL